MFRTKFNDESKQWCGESTESPWDGKNSLGIEIFNALKLHNSKIAQVKPKPQIVLLLSSSSRTSIDSMHGAI